MTADISEVVKQVRGQQMESVHIRLPASVIAQIDEAVQKARQQGNKINRSDVCRTGVLFFWQGRLQNVDASE